LPRLKNFEIEFYPQNADAAYPILIFSHYAFNKLSSKGVAVVACPLQSD
jgi:hypothetical protein